MARSDVTFKMNGHRELMTKLSSMDRKMRRTIATKAVRAGAKIMVSALRSAAPKRTGRGAKAIGTKIKTYRNSQVTAAITGERIERRRGPEKQTKSKWFGPHLHLIEYGTGERFHTGEKAARSAARKLGGLLTSKTLRDVLASTGVFGTVSIVGRNLRGKIAFSRIIRETQAKIKSGDLIARFSKIGKAIHGGHPTGRVRANPFFLKAFRAAVPGVQAAQLAVLRREIEAAASTV